MQSAPRKVSSTCASRSSEPGLRTCPLPKHSVALLEVHLKWCASPLVCVSVSPVPAIPSPRVKYRTSFRVQREKIWLALNELVRFICATTLGPRTRTHGATHARRAPATAPPRCLAPLGAVAHRCRANVASSRYASRREPLAATAAGARYHPTIRAEHGTDADVRRRCARCRFGCTRRGRRRWYRQSACGDMPCALDAAHARVRPLH